jgi:tetratricopeptide (TPR) repeat protein
MDCLEATATYSPLTSALRPPPRDIGDTMQRIILVSLVAISAAASSASFASTSTSRHRVHADTLDATHRAVARGANQARDNDAAGAAATLAGVIQSEGFKQLSPDEQYRVFAIGAAAANATGNHRTALEWSTRACTFPAALGNVDLWHLRLSAAYDLQNYTDSAHSIATIARRWPETLDRINSQAIGRVSSQLADDSALKKNHLELLDSLFDAKWLSHGEQPAWMWLDLARLFLEQGDTASAATVATRIDSPSALVALRVDKRFDKLSHIDPSAFDLEKAIVAYVASAEERARLNPKRLEPLMQLQYVFRETPQPERALRIADEVIAKIGDGKGKKIYEDFDEYYTWILDNRAAALWQLGRWEEALTQERRAARRPEGGGLNVSQALNLAGYYTRLGRVDDALDAMSDLGELSPYGRMQQEAIAAIGATQRNNQAELDTHLAFMRTHRTDALSTYQDALLDANRLEAVSDLLAERLRNLAWRADALASIQIYVDMPMPPLLKIRNARLRAVIARPSVQTEIAKVGRIEQVPLTSPST